MTREDAAETYAKLFESKKEGRYLLNPIVFERLHPGVVGYFDSESGDWTPVADLSDPEAFISDGYVEAYKKLGDYKKATRDWNTRTSESESERSYRTNVGASGAAGGVPAEASVDVKYKKGSAGQAALIASGLVNYEAFLGPFKDSTKQWIAANGRKIIEEHGSAAKENGLWAIKGVYFTDECAIKMTTSSDQDIDVGADIGATGFGKLGGGAGSLEKLKSKSWTTCPAVPGSKGQVVSFHGLKFKARSLSKLWSSNDFSFNMACSFGPVSTSERPVYDEDGKLSGFEAVRRVKKEREDDSYFEIEKTEEPKKADAPEDAEDDDEVDEEGMTEEDIQAERAEQKALEDERNQMKLETWNNFVKETESMNRNLAEARA
ncbi:uncharacterized protein N7511_001457 [Penicillium nucicola]|uniref:uncharacterized protein n=1 Tax=Penicillium nucicola TaxID=1850975 RepID=UPI002544E0CA|nr:uncharacterized protein N7511_001457 [Penicillium nucicola]KAJ5776446.1 hypothetical protein N7511_001457 [Penicillium nucicola]